MVTRCDRWLLRSCCCATLGPLSICPCCRMMRSSSLTMESFAAILQYVSYRPVNLFTSHGLMALVADTRQSVQPMCCILTADDCNCTVLNLEILQKLASGPSDTGYLQTFMCSSHEDVLQTHHRLSFCMRKISNLWLRLTFVLKVHGTKRTFYVSKTFLCMHGVIRLLFIQDCLRSLK